MSVTNLDKAKVAIVTQHPFFASILMKRKLIVDRTIPTAGVDQRGQIYYNPEFFDKLSVDEIVFVLCHEIGHVIGQHASRRGTRDAKNWNIAGDAWINDMLKDAKIGQQVKGCVDMAGSKDRTVDAIYDDLPPPQDGDGRGPGGTGDDLLDRGDPISAEEADRIDAETRVEIAQAAQAAKAQGKFEGKLAEIVAELIQVKTPWYDILERYMVSFTKGDYSWKRPNKRYDIYLPSVGQTANMGEIVIQIDVSGSISEQELNYYNGHLARIVEQCQPERVHVLYTDTSVCKHEVFEQGEEFKLEFYSGGGTDMEAGFDFVDVNGINPEVFICLTDGYTDFNMEKAPSYPVVWCISSEVTAPYGDVIHFELEYA
jgi:predicted metal-dependent peptidase